MSFYARPVQSEDLQDLLGLAEQFNLLNLPANENILKEKIERSIKSFKSEIPKEAREYIFVLVDVEDNLLVGCSLILAKHGTPEVPHYYFKVDRRERVSEDLGIGFIHHVLQLNEETNGPSEIGGLLVNPKYRGHKSKLGKFISLVRFLYIAKNPQYFQKEILCEFAPRLSEEGKSYLWEELGRKFTGLTYEEADRLSLKNKGFIRQLFPIEGVYLNLLSPEVRMNLGKVSQQTEPAKHLLSSIGFSYKGEIDPFDGGPHFKCEKQEISLIKNFRKIKPQFKQDNEIQFNALLMNDSGEGFLGLQAEYNEEKDELYLANDMREYFNNKDLQESYFSKI
ncbi:MAG: arginine N-succinyltransferase [Bdellovibrionota bacterium]